MHVHPKNFQAALAGQRVIDHHQYLFRRQERLKHAKDGQAQRIEQRLFLHRIFFRNDDSPVVLGRKVRGTYDWITWKERLGYFVRSFRA